MKREADSSLDDKPSQRRKTEEKEPVSIDVDRENIPTLSSYPSITDDTETASRPMTFPEYDKAVASREEAKAKALQTQLLKKTQVMVGKPGHVFTMSFEEVGEAQMLSVHHSFEGAVLAAWKACNEHGYQDDFSQHVEDDSDISDLEKEDEPANKIEALKAAVLQRAKLQGTSLCLIWRLNIHILSLLLSLSNCTTSKSEPTASVFAPATRRQCCCQCVNKRRLFSKLHLRHALVSITSNAYCINTMVVQTFVLSTSQTTARLVATHH